MAIQEEEQSDFIEASEEIEEKSQPKDFICPICGKKCKDLKGLKGHQRLTHKSPTKQDGYKEYVDQALEKIQKVFQDFSTKIVAQFQAENEVFEALIKRLSALETSFSALKQVQDPALIQRLLDDYNKKNQAIANFLENHIEMFERAVPGAKRCENDIKGLALLRKDFSLNGVKEQKSS